MARTLFFGLIAIIASSPALAQDDEIIDLESHETDADQDDFVEAFGEDAVKSTDGSSTAAEPAAAPDVADDENEDDFEDYDEKEAKVDALIEDFDDLDEEMDFELDDGGSLDGYGPDDDDDEGGFDAESLDDMDLDLSGGSSRPAVDSKEAAIIDEYGLEEGGPDMPGEPGLDDFDEFGPEEDLDGLDSMGDMDILDEPTEEELARQNTKPGDFGLNLREARVMADNWPVDVVERGPDAVVVELPVLVAKEEMDFSGEETWLVARFIANGDGAGEQRHLIAAETVLPVSPTIVWVKAHVPVAQARGEIEVRIYQAFRDGDEVSLFSRAAKY